MKQFTYVLKDENGLHARPAAQFAKLASSFSCGVQLTTPDASADAKRIMAVMKLVAKQGTPLTVACDGADEEAAAAALSEFLEKNL
jgi:phosphocarrier protein HPr